MNRNEFIRQTKLHDVCGRIDYISSPVRQEHLYATYQTDKAFPWKELAKESQTEFKKNGTTGKCIEARELVIALPEYYQEYYPNEVLKTFTEHFKSKYGVECVSALHHNNRMNNYHIHLIYSERTLLSEPIRKTATRAVFFDEQGKRVRTKKEICDEAGNIRSGCQVIKKGEVYEQHMFTPKNKYFKSKEFLDDMKDSYLELINERALEDYQKLTKFRRDGLHLATKKVGKHNPRAKEIMADNAMKMKWNNAVDLALEKQVPESGIRDMKDKVIHEPLKKVDGKQIKESGFFRKVLRVAVTTLNIFLKNWIRTPCTERPEAQTDRFMRWVEQAYERAQRKILMQEIDRNR